MKPKWPRPGFPCPGSDALDLANAHAAAGDATGEFDPNLWLSDRKQCPSVAGGKAALFEQVLNRLFEFQKADGVGDGGAVLTGALGDLLLCEAELIREALEGVGLLDRVQVLALEVFDERHLERDFLGNVANDDGNARECGPLGGAPAAFTGNQLVAKTHPADDERLHDSARTDRARQLFDGLLAEAGARLIGAGIDQVDIDLKQNVSLSRRWGHRCCCRRSRRHLRLRRMRLLLCLLFLDRLRDRFPDQGAQSLAQGVSGHWR